MCWINLAAVKVKMVPYSRSSINEQVSNHFEFFGNSMISMRLLKGSCDLLEIHGNENEYAKYRLTLSLAIVGNRCLNTVLILSKVFPSYFTDTFYKSIALTILPWMLFGFNNFLTSTWYALMCFLLGYHNASQISPSCRLVCLIILRVPI